MHPMTGGKSGLDQRRSSGRMPHAPVEDGKEDGSAWHWRFHDAAVKFSIFAGSWAKENW
jgi:hypothetical protein